MSTIDHRDIGVYGKVTFRGYGCFLGLDVRASGTTAGRELRGVEDKQNGPVLRWHDRRTSSCSFDEMFRDI